MGHLVRFQPYSEITTDRDALAFRFPFQVVNTSAVGKADEISLTTQHVVDVSVSGTQAAVWGVQLALLPKILFEYGRQHIEQKIVDGVLGPKESLDLYTGNTESPCPFSPAHIAEPSTAQFEIEIQGSPLMESESSVSLASRIVDLRDNINAVFHSKHNEKLLTIREERDLVQFFREAASAEEFFYRLCALANLVTNLNISVLRKITGIADNEKKSLSLLGAYLAQAGSSTDDVVPPLRHINRLRQAYPVHGDRVNGVLEAHRSLGIEYPIRDHQLAWR